MDWTSDSDENNDPAAAGPSNEVWISDSDENPDLDRDTHGTEPAPTRNVAAFPSKEASEAGPSHSNWTSHFVAMGFSEDLVADAIKQNREGDTEGVLETLLTYGAIENSPELAIPRNCSSVGDENTAEDDSSEMEDFGLKDFADDSPEKDKIVSTLVDMGFLAEEASSAIDICGLSASLSELVDFIRAAQMQEDSDDQLGESSVSSSSSYDDSDDSECNEYNTFKRKKGRSSEYAKKNKRIRICERKTEFWKSIRLNNDEVPLSLPNQLVGFGIPFEQPQSTHRKLPEAAIGPPFFYYENVALAPKGVWDTISRFLYDVEPEFVDSKFFCAAARKRGYVHNLPINKRFPLLPIPPKTIHEAFPSTRKWWPSWDNRTHLNCLQTCLGSPKLCERIRSALSQYNDPPPERIQRYVLDECNKYNLVWVGLHKVAPLEPDELEMVLGFPGHHTRGISRRDRYKALGNSFQIDTVAFHLSVLRDMFPNGITVLSLFSGIGGAEVALHRLGIRLKTVVSVEASVIYRTVVRTWWEQTNQTGTLIDISDVQRLNGDRLEHLIHTYGGFDLVIGGSPCDNPSDGKRHNQDGVEDKNSALFYEYFRILDLVKCIMEKN